MTFVRERVLLLVSMVNRLATRICGINVQIRTLESMVECSQLVRLYGCVRLMANLFSFIFILPKHLLGKNSLLKKCPGTTVYPHTKE